MPRDYRLYLDDILDSIDKIFFYIEKMDFDEFSRDQKTVDAVVRNLEIVGEAARNLPTDIRESGTQIEWKKIVGLRNILVHEYFGINTKIIWDIVKTKLLPLQATCQKLLETE